MQVLTLELLNEEVLPILRQLELMRLLRFIHTQAQPLKKKRKWAGSISTKTADNLLEQHQQMRQEWERNI